MAATTRNRPTARALSAAVGTAALLALVGMFLVWMATLVSDTWYVRSMATAAVIALLGAVLALLLGLHFRRGGGSSGSALVWSAGALPVVATGLAAAAAMVQALPWLTVPLVFFTTTPVAVLAMLLPSLRRLTDTPDTEV